MFNYRQQLYYYFIFKKSGDDFRTWFFQYWVRLNGDKEKAYIDAISPLDPSNFIAKAAPLSLFLQFVSKDNYISKVVYRRVLCRRFGT